MVLGWNEAVHAGPARDAAMALYGHASDHGSTVESSWRALDGFIALIMFALAGSLLLGLGETRPA